MAVTTALLRGAERLTPGDAVHVEHKWEADARPPIVDHRGWRPIIAAVGRALAHLGALGRRGDRGRARLVTRDTPVRGGARGSLPGERALRVADVVVGGGVGAAEKREQARVGGVLLHVSQRAAARRSILLPREPLLHLRQDDVQPFKLDF
jgi:hypothetical protein